MRVPHATEDKSDNKMDNFTIN